MMDLIAQNSTAFLAALLVSLSVGLLLLVFFDRGAFRSVRAEKRIRSLSNRKMAVNPSSNAQAAKRRKSIQDQLKEIDDRQKGQSASSSERMTLNRQLEQAGLNWTRSVFLLVSIGCGLAGAMLGILAGMPLYMIIGGGVVSAFALPRVYIARSQKKRMNYFINELPNAIDMIIRGTKAGLPLGECIKIIARETRDPVCGEFRRIVDSQALGVTVPAAFARMSERIQLPEARYLAIAIGIQQEAGGSLSETLTNLSKVLRARQAMKGKIKAMSAEAVASASIIGSLPILIGVGFYFMAPTYLEVLFVETIGNIVLAGCAFWMLTGIFVMRSMINFDF